MRSAVSARHLSCIATGGARPSRALRIALQPDGLASHTSNLADWSGFLLARLRREIEATGDPELGALYEELAAYPEVARGE